MGDKIRRALAVLLATVLLGVGLNAAGASPAQASAAQCNSANICLWDGVNYTGTIYQWSVGYIRTLEGDCLFLSGSQSNTASSLAVNGKLSTTRITFFDLAAGGETRAVGTGVTSFWDTDLRYSPGMANFSNRISSICVF